MFQIKANNKILYDYRSDHLKIFNPKLSLEANTTGSFNFKIYPSHQFFSEIEKLKTIIKVYQNDRLIFRGRVLEDKEDFNKAKDVDCEGELAFLLDSVYRPFDLKNQSVSIMQFLTMLIENHNSQVMDFQKFILGNVTVEDNNEKINFGSESALKTWDIIKTKLIDNYGGYLYITYDENEMPILNYLKEPPYTAMQTIEYGKNLLDISNLVSGSDIATACIPYGAKQKDTNGNETSTRLDITSVNDGKDYLINEEMAKIYGIIYADPALTTWDDVTTAINLKTKGAKFLGDSVKLSATIELKAVDLSNVTDIQAFHFLEHIQIISLYHNINKVYLLEKIEIDLFNPQNTTIVLGTTFKTLTDTSLNDKNEMQNAITKIEEITKDYVTNEKVSEIVNETIEQSTAIIQTAQSVVIAALQEYVLKQNFEEYQETISTQFEQTAKDFTFLFNTAITQIEEVNGQTNKQFQEIQKYIRLEDGNIILGEVGNELTLNIQNDRIQFLQDNVEVAYFSNNRLYVTDGEFLNSLQLGRFAFKPRANGSLSFGKVGR